MVNRSVKQKIHSHLTRKNNWLSGEELSAILGISRVAVWKHLQKMRESGYPLVSGPRGYMLDPCEDTLAPWAFEIDDRDLFHFPLIESTMDKARELAEVGTSPGAVVLAEEQTKGKARLEREWDSAPGGLYFTIIDYPIGPLSQIEHLHRTAVLSVLETLTQDFRISAWCRKPNDIWTEKGKIAGVLLEVSGEIERIRWVNTGIGINIRNHPRVFDKRAASLEYWRKDVKRRDFLSAFLLRYETNGKLTVAEILKKWNETENQFFRFQE